MRSMMKRLEKTLPELSEHERILWARSLAATPDERWKMSQQFRRLLKSSPACMPKK